MRSYYYYFFFFAHSSPVDFREINYTIHEYAMVS